MKLHPNMRLLGKVDIPSMEFHLEKCLTKVRYRNMEPSTSSTSGRVRNNQDPRFTHSCLPLHCTPDETTPINARNRLDFPSLRVTQVPTNKEVLLPELLKTDEETKLLAFKSEVLNATECFIRNNCDKQGRQKLNLKKEEEEGLRSIRRRVREEDLVVMETDKSKRLSIMTKENYVASTEPHTSNDPVLTEEELSNIERLLNGHTLQFTRAFLICHNQGDMRRLKMAMHNECLEPPALRAVRKDHKLVPPELREFGPPSRPIGNGNNAPDSQLSWILATICQRAADSLNSQYECDSTQDMLAAIDEENANLHKPSNQVCFSLDAVALYPSMEAQETAEICSDLVVSSGLWIEAVDWEEVALYLVLTGATNGVSPDLLPTRKHSSGPKPCITTAEVVGPIVRNRGEKSKFVSPQRSPTIEESKWMLKQMIKEGIVTVMKNHTYRWNNSYRLQSSGGGIGDKLAQAAARLFMIW